MASITFRNIPICCPGLLVSESLAAFMVAEQMAGHQTASENEIEQAMFDAQTRQASVNAAINSRSNGRG